MLPQRFLPAKLTPKLDKSSSNKISETGAWWGVGGVIVEGARTADHLKKN